MRSWSYHLLALFVVLCWGMTLVSSKVLLNFGMQPWALVELRSVLAYGILIFLAIKKEMEPSLLLPIGF